VGRLIISENLSLDGIVQDPTGEEGLDFGGWFNDVTELDRAEWAKMAFEEALRTEAVLLGRRSYEYFDARWPSRTGAFADRLNTLAKYVVSSTVQNATWNNTTVLKGPAAAEVSNLKEQVTGDIVVYACAQLVHGLMQHDLVDEVRLMIYPFILGNGERIFPGATDKKRMSLAHVEAVGDSLAYLVYQIACDPSSNASG
jgi:dihydrofolate reductase